MTKADLLSQKEYEIKLNGAGQNEIDGELTYFATCNIQLFDLEKKVTKKAVSGVMGVGSSILEAEDNALNRACELLGNV